MHSVSPGNNFDKKFNETLLENLFTIKILTELLLKIKPATLEDKLLNDFAPGKKNYLPLKRLIEKAAKHWPFLYYRRIMRLDDRWANMF